MSNTYKSPDVPAEKVTPKFVRDELLTCLESANREFSKILNQPVTDDVLKQQVKQFVQSIFTSCGGNFENPSRESILLAITQCKANAEKMMGPQGVGIIRDHYDEMIKLVNKLPK
jgi:hypothetical protein